MLSIATDMVRGLPRTYWFLWWGTLVNRVGTFVVPFLALYLTEDRGMSVERAGVVAALYGVGSFAAGPIGGVLADRIGRRATMALSLFGGAAAMIHLGVARDPHHIYAAAALLGLIGDLYRPAVWAAVADVVPPPDRLRAFGFLYWAINLGFATAATVAGILAAGGFWLLFAGDAFTSAAMGVVVVAFIPETRPREAIERPAHLAMSDALAPFGDGVFMSFVLLAFLISLLFMQFTVALPLDLRAHGISRGQFGALIAINGVLIVLLQPFVSRVIQGYRRARVLALAALFVGMGFGLTAFARTAPAYAVTIAIWTFGEILYSPVTPAVIADLAPVALRGTYQGVHQMAWGAATCLAPVFGSTVLARVSSKALWLACFAIGVVAAIAHLVIAGPRRRRLAAMGVTARD